MSLETATLPSGVLERLQDPATAASVHRLLDRLESLNRALDALEPLVGLAEQAPGAVAMAMDSADEIARTALEAGIDVEKGVFRGAEAALRFGAIMDAEKVRSLEALLQSGVLDPAALDIIGQLARALRATSQASPSPVGVFGLLGAASDPDVRRALGFLVAFGKQFGQGLAETAPAAR